MLKREVHQLSRELLREKAKVKALSEELENPLNVHRWRKLEGSDPTAYEMVQKIQTLQKRLIAKTEEVIEKDLLIQEREKLYLELKGILARQPGPEVAEQLSVYQQTLREKTRQMKSMASELNMYQARTLLGWNPQPTAPEECRDPQVLLVRCCISAPARGRYESVANGPLPRSVVLQAQVSEYKYEIERLVRELNEVKRKYFEQRRREQMQGGKPSTAPGDSGAFGASGRNQLNQTAPAMAMPATTQPQQRFVGGGFNVSVS